MRISKKRRRSQAKKRNSVLTGVRQNVESLVARATNYALFETQNTILPYVTKMKMHFQQQIVTLVHIL